jgi:hypothetical protein
VVWEIKRVGSMVAISVLGVIVAVLGIEAGRANWVAIVVGVAMTVVALLVLVLDPPWRNPYRPDFPPLKGPSGRGSAPPRRPRKPR